MIKMSSPATKYAGYLIIRTSPVLGSKLQRLSPKCLK
jgi:hypothetical protein